MIVSTENGIAPSVNSDSVGFGDPETGGIARCVWVDPQGDDIFGELKTPPGGAGTLQGKFATGTGKYRGITGGFTVRGIPTDPAPGEGPIHAQAAEVRGSRRLP